jgi:hypothetical protein
MAKVHPAAPGLFVGALDAALDGLMVQPQRPTDGKKRAILPDKRAISAPRPTRLAGSVRDCAIELNFIVSSSERQFNRPPPRSHDLTARPPPPFRRYAGTPATRHADAPCGKHKRQRASIKTEAPAHINK